MSQAPRLPRILICITKSTWGGATRYTYELAKHCSKKGIVSVCASANGPLMKKLDEQNINTIPLKFLQRDVSIFGDLHTAWSLYRLFKKEKPDIVQLNSSKMMTMGALMARLAGCKRIVSTLHGLALNENRPWYEKTIIALLYLFSVIVNTKIIAVSNAVSHQIKSITPKKYHHKIEVIHNAFEVDTLLSKDEARKSLELPENKYIVGTIGELHHIKGHKYLLNAYAPIAEKNPNIHLCIIGGGEEEQTLRKQIKNLNIENRVTLSGFKENASQYLPAFDLFTFPSLSEAFPLVLQEAAHAKLPVVASAVGGIPEFVEDMKGGILIRPKEAEELQHALEFAIDHKENMKVFAQHLHNRVQKEFTQDKMLEKTAIAMGL